MVLYLLYRVLVTPIHWLFFWCVLFCLLLSTRRTAAQLPIPSGTVYTHYNSYNSSLPAELIYKIHADKNGYVWLATDRGLVRYNGKEFKLISTGRSEDFISAYATTTNQFWLFSYSGHIAAIDLNTQKIINTDSLYQLDKLQSTSAPCLLGIQNGNTLTLHSQGRTITNIGLDTHTSVLQKLTRKELEEELIEQYRLPSGTGMEDLRSELEYVIKHNFYSLSVKDNLITIGNKIFTTAPGRIATVYFNGDDYGIHTYIMGFVRRDNDLYLGSLYKEGLYRIRNYFSLPRRAHIIERLLPAEHITSIEKDYLGNIWAGTHGNGLFLLPYTEANTLHYDKNKSGLYSDEVSCIQRFPGNLTVLGYGDAMVDFYHSSAHPHRYPVPVRDDIREVNHVERTATRWLLFTPTEAFNAYHNKAESFYPTRFSTARLKGSGIGPGYKNGKLLNGLFHYVCGNTIAIIDTAGAIGRHPLAAYIAAKKTCILPLSDSDFYIGTIHGCYHNAVALPYLRDVQITGIDTINQQIFWVTNTGVYAIPQQEAYNRHMLRQIIPEPCSAIRHDRTFTYLRCIDELIIIRNATLQVVARFSCKEYYQPFRLNDFYADEHYLALAGNLGLFYIPLSSLLHRPGQVAIKVHVLCSLNSYAPADSIYQCPYSNNLSALFEIDILDYKMGRHIVSCNVLKDGKEIYRQMNLKENGEIALRPSAPGRYRIEYHVRTTYNAKEQVFSYVLQVTPLWYQRWWCISLLAIVAGLLFFYLLYRLYAHKVKKDRRKLEYEIHLHELESQSLFSQLKPHFIFNVLTPLQGFFIRGEKMQGLNYLNNFSQLMRGVLNGIRDKDASLKTEIDFITHYLQIQQERFNHCFDFYITVDPELDLANSFIPTLLLQPIVENAVEHGIRKSSNDGRIDISVEAGTDTVIIKVTNNGEGLPTDFRLKKNHALSIIAERVQLLKKMKGTGAFSIANCDMEKGVCAMLILAKDKRI